MIPYSRPKRSDLYTLSQSKLLENHILHSGTYLYSPYMAVPTPPPPRLVTEHFMLHLQVNELICSSRINLNLNVAICMFQKQFVCRSRRSLVAVAIIYLYLVKKISLLPNSQHAFSNNLSRNYCSCFI